MKSNRWWPIAALAAICACSHRPNDYSAFADIEPEGWKYGKTFLFLPQVDDSLCHGTLTLAVRHTNAYPYANLYLEVVTQQPTPGGGVTFRTDTLNMTLADTSGRWLGKGLGTSFQRTDTLSRSFTLLNGSPIRVRHVMRDDLLPEVEQVGILFTADNQ